LSHDIITAYGGEIKAENITTGEPGNQKQETAFVISSPANTRKLK